MPGKPVLYVCGGGDCDKAAGATGKLVAAVAGHAQVRTVRCQKICSGPVCGTELDGKLEWFGEVRGKKARAAVVAMLRDGRLQRALARHHAPKRSGKLRD